MSFHIVTEPIDRWPLPESRGPRRDGTHRCPSSGCNYRVPRRHLACPRHWARVTPETQRRVYAANRAGDNAEHAAAVRDAIAEINSPPAAAPAPVGVNT